MNIVIHKADTSDYYITIEELNIPSDLGVINKVTQALYEYYENRQFMTVENKLEKLAKGE